MMSLKEQDTWSSCPRINIDVFLIGALSGIVTDEFKDGMSL